MAQGIETKVTDWSICKDGPWYSELPHGGTVAYRIWQQFDGLRWFQRHEWKHADGSIELDGWINGARGWTAGAQSIALAEAA